MSDNLFRLYHKLDPKEISEHLLVYGDLGASCTKCKKIDLKIDMTHCPECKTEFKYVSFRNVKVHIPKIHKLLEDRPDVKIIDHEDYKRNIGAQKAKDFLK